MFSGYESPITQIIGQLETQMEDDCMKVVQQCGFDVNKEELARALTYDRDQYDKGYDDGYTKAIDDVMAKAKEIQEEQIKNLEQHPKRHGKQWAIYINTHLGHIQVACKRLIAEQLKEGSADNE